MKNIICIVVSFCGLLISCSKDSPIHQDDADKTIEVRLSASRITSRAIDEPIEGYNLPYSSINSLHIDFYETPSGSSLNAGFDLSAEQIARIKATPSGAEYATINLKSIPFKTKFIRVLINGFETENPYINELQPLRYMTSAPTEPSMDMDKIPYEGVSPELMIIESTPELITCRTTVQVAPLLSRFEVAFGGGLKIITPEAVTYQKESTTLRTKIIGMGFSEAEIVAVENNALLNYKLKYGADITTPYTLFYDIECIEGVLYRGYQSTFLIENFVYVNYFKNRLNDTDLVKNENNQFNDWWDSNQYGIGYLHSKMKDLLLPMDVASEMLVTNFGFSSTMIGKTVVNAFHLFPQKVADDATLQQVKDGMPHIILKLTPPSSSSRSRAYGIYHWLTIRAFKDKTTGKLITSFEPGKCYQLKLSDIDFKPWKLNLRVAVVPGNVNVFPGVENAVISDPVIKDFDQSSHVPEPDGVGIVAKLTVIPWRVKDTEVGL